MLAVVWIMTVEPAFADVKKLPSLPDREGFASMFAGVSHDALLVAGGANFPDKRPWEGGKKIWYNAIFVLEKPDGQWKKAGSLPRPLAYGVSATHRDRLICVGGSDADRHYTDCFQLEWKDGKVLTTALPELPKPIANACGSLVGEVLYVAGGQEKPDSTTALKSVFLLDLSANPLKWKQLDPLPGPARILATAAIFDNILYVVGGAELYADKDGAVKRTYLKDSYRYDPGTGWKKIADLPVPIVAAPSPALSNNQGFLILGGDDGANLGFQPPEKHPGFRSEILRYDPKTDKWHDDGRLPVARVTAPLVKWGEAWIIVSGEVRPGMRSPEVWQIDLERTK